MKDFREINSGVKDRGVNVENFTVIYFNFLQIKRTFNIFSSSIKVWESYRQKFKLKNINININTRHLSGGKIYEKIKSNN